MTEPRRSVTPEQYASLVHERNTLAKRLAHRLRQRQAARRSASLPLSEPDDFGSAPSPRHARAFAFEICADGVESGDEHSVGAQSNVAGAQHSSSSARGEDEQSLQARVLALKQENVLLHAAADALPPAATRSPAAPARAVAVMHEAAATELAALRARCTELVRQRDEARALAAAALAADAPPSAPQTRCPQCAVAQSALAAVLSADALPPPDAIDVRAFEAAAAAAAAVTTADSAARGGASVTARLTRELRESQRQAKALEAELGREREARARAEAAASTGEAARWRAACTSLQRQLAGALRRISWAARREAESRKASAAREQYVATVERRLVALHGRLQRASAAAPRRARTAKHALSRPASVDAATALCETDLAELDAAIEQLRNLT